MSKNEFDHLTIMRVRTGPSQGDAIERKMLDVIDDTGSFRTRVFTHPDGSTTRMKTKGGMPEFITDEVSTEQTESTCTLKMDSGVVDLVSATFSGALPDDAADGILHRTDYVSQHIAANPNGSSFGPVDGAIHPPNYAGESPDDGLVAASFSRLVDGQDAGSSYDKKRMVTMCPPSMFTGKMRQYVQALYGRHDHAEFFSVPESSPPAGACVYFNDAGDFEGEGTVTFDTNCGIFVDTANATHYLIKLVSNYAHIYPMIVTACAKKLRSKLLDPNVSLGAKARIETYILSRSRPDTTRIVTVPTQNSLLSSMGYGWHFNSDGSVCDIVVTEYLPNDDNFSTHLSMRFARSSVGAWSVTTAIVEQAQWKHLRFSEVIAYPEWSFSTFRRLGVTGYTAPYGDAPFYVFYRRLPFSESTAGSFSSIMQSERVVCRYETHGDNISKDGIRNPSWLNPDRLLTVGDQSMDRVTWADYTKQATTFTCGGESLSLSSGSHVEYEVHRTAPTVIIPPVEDWWIPLYNPPQTIDVSVGNGADPPEGAIVGLIPYDDYYEGAIMVSSATEGLGNAPYETQSLTLLGGDYAQTPGGGIASGSFTQESFTTTVNEDTGFLYIIPFYDAESVYVAGEKTTTRSETGSYYTGEAAFFNMRGRVVDGSLSDVSYCGVFGPSNESFYEGGSGSFVNRPGTPDTQTSAFAVGPYGREDAPFTRWAAQFFAGENTEIIPVFLSHRSSALGAAGHSVDFQVYKNLGVNDLEDKPIAFVGWA